MTKKHSRRDFLKGALKGTAAASVVATGAVGLDKLKASREPKEGERFNLWSGPETTCQNCGHKGELLNGAAAIYSGDKNEMGQYIFLIQDRIYCPGCYRHFGQYWGDDTKFVWIDSGGAAQDV